ncbi:MAG: Gfo/Idh/MocA family oxidoreductase [Kiritimatiellae bacterium]|nr:Gfo/Idh/MocA family oxidoreductase [Kiritimatiellia bacterium]
MKRFAILGTGMIAAFHAEALAAMEGGRLVAVCDRDGGRARAFADAHGLSPGCAFDDIDVLLGGGGVDVLLVATPSGFHHEGVLAAARHGVHVLCEKPLEISTARIDRLAAICGEAEVFLGGIFQTRWTDTFMEARRLIDSGALGRLTYASVQVPWWRSDDYYAGSSWRGTYAVDGGGALMNQGIHMLDWLTALMPPVEEVKAFTATLAHDIEAEDTAVAVIRFRGGALGHVYATTASFPGSAKRFELHGTKGTFVFDDSEHGAARPDHIESELHRRCFTAFAAALDGGPAYPVDAAEARKSVALVEAICGVHPDPILPILTNPTNH